MAKETYPIKIKESQWLKPSQIIQDNNPKIREISIDASFPLEKDEESYMKKMIDYVRASHDSVKGPERELTPAYGISGVQAGINKKMLYARIENDFGGVEEFALVNPKITWTSDKLSYLGSGEGCLSVKRKFDGYVYRPYQIKMIAIDYFTEREVEIEARGLTSIVLQHEMDHLSGVLFYDRINRLNPFEERKNTIKIN